MPDISAYRAECLLKGGAPTILRAIRPDDRRSIIDAFKDAAPESIYTRFFAYKKSLSDAELSDLTDVDFDRVVALVATTRVGDRESLIAGGRYVVSESASGDRTAELAFMTRGDYRGQGVARLLLAHLASIARQHDIQRFEAVVLPENAAMLSVFRGCGLPVEMVMEDGVVHVQIHLRESAGPKVPKATNGTD